MLTSVHDVLLTPEEAAAALKCSRTTLLRREQSGLLRAVRSGKRRLYRESDVRRLIQPVVVESTNSGGAPA
jgi:excisionase family DNA binding protein